MWYRENLCGITGLNLIAGAQLMGCFIALHWPVLQLRTQEVWADISSASLRKRKSICQGCLHSEKKPNRYLWGYPLSGNSFGLSCLVFVSLSGEDTPWLPKVPESWTTYRSLTISGDCECSSSANLLHFSVLSHAVVVRCPWHTACSRGHGVFWRDGWSPGEQVENK